MAMGKNTWRPNFMLLTFLAFLIDQIAQSDASFKKELDYCKTKKRLWEKVRQVLI